MVEAEGEGGVRRWAVLMRAAGEAGVYPSTLWAETAGTGRAAALLSILKRKIF